MSACDGQVEAHGCYYFCVLIFYFFAPLKWFTFDSFYFWKTMFLGNCDEHICVVLCHIVFIERALETLIRIWSLVHEKKKFLNFLKKKKSFTKNK